MTNLTNLEIEVLRSIDNSEYGDLITDAVWFWAADMASDIGISAKAVGGVVTSLLEKGLVHVFIATARDRRNGDESTISMTQSGAEAYKAAVGETRKSLTNEEANARWDARRAAEEAPKTNSQEDFVAALLA